MNIASLLTLDPDMPVASFTATIKKIWPTKRGKIKQGPRKGQDWHIQDIVVEDNTGEIKIKNWAEELSKSDAGETFTFSSHKNAKNQLVGLKIEFDDYDKKNVVVMNDSAKITLPDGSAVSSVPKDSGADATPANHAPVRDPMELARQAGEACRIAMEVALDLAEKIHSRYAEVTGESVTTEQINSWASSINYYLRDQGVIKQLKVSDPAPQIDPPAPVADDDEIPF